MYTISCYVKFKSDLLANIIILYLKRRNLMVLSTKLLSSFKINNCSLFLITACKKEKENEKLTKNNKNSKPKNKIILENLTK